MSRIVPSPICKVISLVVLSVALSACGGGGSSIPAATTEPEITGQFVDTVVQGLEYQCGSTRGITNANGEFTCHVGERVSFSLAGFNLGSIQVTANTTFITPMALLDEELSSDVVKAIAVLLLNLDADTDVNNGIQLDSSLLELMRPYVDLFDLSNVSIATIISFIEIQLNQSVVFNAAGAEEHLRESIKTLRAGFYTGMLTTQGNAGEGTEVFFMLVGRDGKLSGYPYKNEWDALSMLQLLNEIDSVSPLSVDRFASDGLTVAVDLEDISLESGYFGRGSLSYDENFNVNGNIVFDELNYPFQGVKQEAVDVLVHGLNVDGCGIINYRLTDDNGEELFQGGFYLDESACGSGVIEDSADIKSTAVVHSYDAQTSTARYMVMHHDLDATGESQNAYLLDVYAHFNGSTIEAVSGDWVSFNSGEKGMVDSPDGTANGDLQLGYCCGSSIIDGIQIQYLDYKLYLD